MEATTWESLLREIKGLRNEMKVSEHLQAQNLVTFCAFRFYTQRERVLLQPSLDSDSNILKPEGTIRLCLLTFCVTQIIKHFAEIFCTEPNNQCGVISHGCFIMKFFSQYLILKVK